MYGVLDGPREHNPTRKCSLLLKMVGVRKVKKDNNKDNINWTFQQL